MIDLPRHMLELQIKEYKERLAGFESGATYAQPVVQKMCEEAAERGGAELRPLLEEGLAAAELALAWMHDPDASPLEEFEQIAARFYAETGFMRPGKDTPMAANGPSQELRREKFGEWCVAKSREVRAALLAFVAKARGE